MTTYRLIRTVHYAARGGRLRKVQIVNQVLDRTTSGPCLAPVDFPVPAPGGDTKLVRVPCGRRLRPEDQCENCRVEVHVVEHRHLVHSQPTTVLEPVADAAPPAVAERGAA